MTNESIEVIDARQVKVTIKTAYLTKNDPMKYHNQTWKWHIGYYGFKNLTPSYGICISKIYADHFDLIFSDGRSEVVEIKT